jgi:dUTP pyrophosphatase
MLYTNESGLVGLDVKIEVMEEGIQLPEYSCYGDAGCDLRASEDCFIYPGQTALIPTKLKVKIPLGYEIQIRPRSGISGRTPLRVANSPGTIDSGFRDEVKVLLHNTSPYHKDGVLLKNLSESGEGVYIIKKGDRIAQMILNKIPTIFWNVVESVDDENNRNSGFGGTGVE